MTHPTDSGHLAYILAKREGIVAHLSPAAQHAAFPKIYAKPMPFPTTGEAAITEIKRLTKENAELVAETFRLKARIDELRASKPIAAGPIFIATTIRGTPQAKDLIRIAALVSGISLDVLMSRSRMRSVAYPRHFAIWLVREIRWDLSLNQLAVEFGGLDHTSVMHALKNVANLRESSPFRDWIADKRIVDTLAACKKRPEGAP